MEKDSQLEEEHICLFCIYLFWKLTERQSPAFGWVIIYVIHDRKSIAGDI